MARVLVFLGPKGDILRSCELADVLTQCEIASCTHSVSSIWWSEPGWFALYDQDKQFAFVTRFGPQCFGVAAGKSIPLNEKRLAEVRPLPSNRPCASPEEYENIGESERRRIVWCVEGRRSYTPI